MMEENFFSRNSFRRWRGFSCLESDLSRLWPPRLTPLVGDLRYRRSRTPEESGVQAPEGENHRRSWQDDCGKRAEDRGHQAQS
jgi:hypothetical protein